MSTNDETGAQQPLSGQTVLMSGGSRGIGLAIAVRLARAGANISFVAKSVTEDPRVPGTIHSAAATIEAAGGSALPIQGDIRDAQTSTDAVARTLAHFGGIDIVVNNASAIDLRGLDSLEPRRFDLMLDVNVRGTYQLIHAALPALISSGRGQVLTLSPPLDPDPRWLAEHAPYTLTKYAMTMLTLGTAEQFRAEGIAAYCLWPETLVATAAVRNIVAGDEGMAAARRPDVMADAAFHLVTNDAALSTGRCHIDADVLAGAGVEDLAQYAAVPGTPDSGLQPDLFVSDVGMARTRPQ